MMYKVMVFKEQQEHFHGCSEEPQASLNKEVNFGDGWQRA